MSQEDFVDLEDEPYPEMNEEDGEDFAFEHSGGNEDDLKFDMIVGKLEDILMEPRFSERQTKFFTKYCDEFEDSDENKLSYTPIFEEYVNLVEGYLESRLSAEIRGFSMAEFLIMLQERESEVSGDVFELLYSLGDFQVFKDLMLSEKRGKRINESTVNGNPLGLSVTKFVIHKEEEEEGEARPDLFLDIKPVRSTRKK